MDEHDETPPRTDVTFSLCFPEKDDGKDGAEIGQWLWEAGRALAKALGLLADALGL